LRFLGAFHSLLSVVAVIFFRAMLLFIPLGNIERYR
jgi:hypothetical protein